MPTYEYACKTCDHRFEVVQSFSEDALTTCPECEQEALRKVYNAAGIIFKGDGWHIKDYAGAGTKPAAAEGTTSNSSDTSGPAGKQKKQKKRGAGDASGSAASKPAAN